MTTTISNISATRDELNLITRVLNNDLSGGDSIGIQLRTMSKPVQLVVMSYIHSRTTLLRVLESGMAEEQIEGEKLARFLSMQIEFLEQRVEQGETSIDQPCTHNWSIDPGDGKFSEGQCQVCGEVREFINYIDEDTGKYKYNA